MTQKEFRTGYVALVGLPNVGKSTLLNRLLGEKLSIVTKRPQTTRHRILGILNQSHAQIIFLDTPGIHDSKKLLNQTMVEAALTALHEADVVVHLVFPEFGLSEEDEQLSQEIKKQGKGYLVAINQVDRIHKETLLPLIKKISETWQPEAIFPLSAKTGEGCESLLQALAKYLPVSEALYDRELYTEHPVRFLCEEVVREKATDLLHQEIPYGLTTQVEKFSEEEKRVHIHMQLIVERENHKAMVIGAKGQMIKKIGTLARQEIEALLGKKVFLELFVKVVPGWTKDEKRLREFGIKR